MIETAKDFRRAIDQAKNRMQEGERQRLAAGEMPGHELCTCGLVIRSAWMGEHIALSPLHHPEWPYWS